MQTKKYVITGLLGLCLVGVAAIFLMHQGGLTDVSRVDHTAGLYDMIPGMVDQLIVIDVDDDILGTFTTIDTNLVQLAKEVDSAIAIQYATGSTMYNLLFLQGEHIDIEALKQLGLLADAETNQERQLTDDIWIYGSPASLAWQEQMTYSLRDNIMLLDYMDTFVSQGYNIGFFARPLAGQQVSFLQGAAEKMLATSAMTSLSPDGMAGQLKIHFDEGVIDAYEGNFSPVFTHYVQSGSLVYIEAAGLLDMFGISEQQFLTVVPLLIGQYGAGYSSLLDQESYETLYRALNANLALVLQSSPDSLVGLGASVLFATPDIYDILTVLDPLWRSLVAGIIGSGSLVMDTNDTETVYSMSSPIALDTPMSLARIVRGDEMTRLDIMYARQENSNNGEKNFFTPTYSDETTIIFRIDNAGLSRTNTLPLSSELLLPTGTANIQQGIILGDVRVLGEENILLVNFSTE